MEKDIPLKTTLEVHEIRKAGRIAAEVLAVLPKIIRKGVTTAGINSFCEGELTRRSAKSALFGYRGFPKSVCTAVNHVAAHGIPDNRPLEEGDIITVDLTVEYGGWHGDAAWTYAVGNLGPDAKRLIKAAWQATSAGCRAARAGGRFGDIGEAIQEAALRYGCCVLENYVGHGIGRKLHEEPMVLNSGERDTGRPIVPGLVFTVEPILTLGPGEVKILDDGWTVVAESGGLCAQFEHTLAVFGSRTEVLTFLNNKQPWDYTAPPVT